VGMTIDESRFVYPAAVRMVCETFGIDPVAAIAEGSLIITAEPGKAQRILEDLAGAGIAASVIGTVTADTGTRVMKRRDGGEVPLRMPDQDPFWPVFFEGLG
ncbi:MAG: AIR synthase, partial [Methanomicrobiales archaeon]|nr:AIR synthase [Methanomicrobiales archaeon]